MAKNTPINFITKLNAQRPYDVEHPAVADAAHITLALESDRGRIINSASVRRLQQKTQVFPLERNAAVRSRLTHSLEVQQNGRYIVKTLFNKLQGSTESLGLDGLAGAVESLVEMACLMHDIGNPPFGHFGESGAKNIFSLQKNKNNWQGPIKSSLGYHLINVFNKAAMEQLALDDILSEVKRDYYEQLRKSDTQSIISNKILEYQVIDKTKPN